MVLTGLDWKYFNWQQMEFYGNLNLLKTGIVFADAITTVSPTLRPGDSVAAARLRARGDACSIGVDDLQRHHQRRRLRRVEPDDRPLPGRPNYDAYTISRDGKARCKADLQQRAGVAQTPRRAAAGCDRPAGRPEGVRPDHAK